MLSQKWKNIFIVNVLRCSVIDVLVLKDLIQDASGRKSEFQSLDVYFQLHHNNHTRISGDIEGGGAGVADRPG